MDSSCGNPEALSRPSEAAPADRRDGQTACFYPSLDCLPDQLCRFGDRLSGHFAKRWSKPAAPCAQFAYLVGLIMLLGDSLYVVLSYAAAYGPLGCGCWPPLRTCALQCA